jgi:ribonuclease P protein component
MGDLSFQRQDRLLRSSDFDRVLKGGRKIQTRNLLVFILPAPDDRRRLGMTVTRKFGVAVQRNRAKRVIREAFRHNRDLLPAPLDVVVIVKRDATRPTLVEYERDLVHAFKLYRRMERP